MVSQILRVSLGGVMPGGEVWSTNPCWEIDGTAGSLVTAGEAATIAAAINAVTWPTALRATVAANTTWASVRVEGRLLTGGLQVQAENQKALPLTGSGGTTVHPQQCALTISLRTPGVGPSARGRLYWPANGIALQTADGRISSTDASSILAGAKTFLSGIEAAIQVTLPNANLTVWSRKTANFHDVNELQIGNVVDTQRRRRDALIESYTSTVFP